MKDEYILDDITYVYGYKHGFIDASAYESALKDGIHTNVDIQDLDKKTMLMYACQKKDTEMVALLLKNKASIHLRDRFKFTALMYACNNYNTTIILELLKHYKIPTRKSISEEYIKTLGGVTDYLLMSKQDLKYLINSDWYKTLKQERLILKRDIKRIIISKSENTLKELIKELVKTRNIEINDITDEKTLLILTALKEELKSINEILDKVYKFKTKIDICIQDIVFDGINIYKNEEKKKQLEKNDTMQLG